MTNDSVVERLRLREDQIFLALTIIIAIIAGLSAVLFTLAIQGVKDALFGMSPSALRLILAPTLVSLLTGFLLAKFFPEARGSGVPQTEAAFHLNQGEIRPIVPFGKFLTGMLCVGSGHSMGREGPSVQIGAGLASAIGQWFGLSPARVQNLVPVGAAAALAAAFNTPVAARRRRKSERDRQQYATRAQSECVAADCLCNCITSRRVRRRSRTCETSAGPRRRSARCIKRS